MRLPEKQNGKRAKTRSLKIQPHFRSSRWSEARAPEIRLCGNWLEKLGFVPEQRVSITTKKKLLIIRLAE